MCNVVNLINMQTILNQGFQMYSIHSEISKTQKIITNQPKDRTKQDNHRVYLDWKNSIV